MSRGRCDKIAVNAPAIGRGAPCFRPPPGSEKPRDDEIDSWRLKLLDSQRRSALRAHPLLPLLRQRMRAIALMCAATIFFAALDTSAKSLSGALPAIEIVWARYVAVGDRRHRRGSPLQRIRASSARSRPVLQIVRSLLLLASTTANFLALRQLQLAETSTINFLTPLVRRAAGRSAARRMGRRRAARRGAIGFIGVVVATGPGTSAFQPVVIVAIAGVVCNAGYALTTRMLASADSSRTTLIWTPLAGVALLTPDAALRVGQSADAVGAWRS